MQVNKMTPLSELFDIRYGHSLELNRLTLMAKKDGGIPFVSRKMGDNGISAYVAPVEGEVPADAGQLSCALGGNGVLSTFLQEDPFYSGRDVAHLKPKFDMSKQQLLFYCTCIVANRYRYSYGRQANRSLKDILVPSIAEIPEFVNKTNISRYDGAENKKDSNQLPPITTETWQPFKLQDLFEIKKGKRLTKANMLPGVVPYIGATDSSNGVTAFIGQAPIHDGNTISLSYNGSVAEAFYQPVAFWATDDVNVLYPNFEMTPESALFLCTILRMEKYRFNYGRKWHLERMKGSEIYLPVTTKGEPDWNYMTEYIKRLPFSSQV